MRLSVNFDKYFDYEVLEKKNDTKNKDNTSSYISARFIDTFIPTAKWELIGGLEYNHEENFATSTLGATPTTKTLDDANVFAQAEYEILKNFDAVAGARYTYNSQFGSAFTPKLSLMYEVAEWRFRGGVGTAFRAPSIKELYYDFDHQGMFWVYGNPDLKAEKGLYSSLSAEYTEGLLNVSVSAYYNNINNKITQYDVINAAGGNEKYYKNVSSATLRGIDVTFSYLFSKHLAVRANYSFCDAVDNSTGLQLEDNVKHSGTVSLTWNGRIARSPFSLQIFPDKEFDLIILFGPMYHLYTKEDKVKALMEAKRVLKDEGTILVAYTMNEYSVLMYGFRENHIQECLENGKLDANYRVCPSPEDLYDYVRLEDIDSYNEAAGMERIQIISADGPSDYMRQVLNTMDEKTFQTFIDYHLTTCERPELVGAGSHTVDIIRKKKDGGIENESSRYAL